MKKIDHTKINRNNNSIWLELNNSVKSGNIALITKNIERLRNLQEYYIKLLNLQEMEITILKDEIGGMQNTLNSYEKEWLEEVAKRNGIYDKHKKRIEEGFRP